jgi:hypothetical protein
MNAHGAVLKGAVVRRLTQNCLADLLLGQLVGVTMKGALREVEKEITQAGRFMKSGTGGDGTEGTPLGASGVFAAPTKPVESIP